MDIGSVKATTNVLLTDTIIVESSEVATISTVQKQPKSSKSERPTTVPSKLTTEEYLETNVESNVTESIKNNITYKQVTIGAVAADHAKCSEIGRDVLAKNGSAVDAAIASLLCNGIMQPHSMGIGGGCFMVIYDKESRQVDVINGREIAPKAATREKYINESFLFGPLSIAVPGELKAYWEAHQRHGKLPWKSLFLTSIEMAEEGAALSASAARGLRFIRKKIQRDFNSTIAEIKIYCDKDGKILKEGSTVYRKVLAETLRGIADEGPDYLYSGKGAKRLVKDIKNFDGIITLEDFNKYELRKTPTLTYKYGNFTMYTLGAPSGGHVMGLILRVLEGFNFTPEDLSSLDKEIAMYHKIIETFKFVYADRLKLGDPLYTDLEELLDKMMSPEYAELLRSKIDTNQTYSESYYTNITSKPWDSYGTSHISVLAPDGDAVSVTSTINYYFGSLLYSPSTGIILNNEMADFHAGDYALLDELQSESANYIAPGKMPLSSMAPAIFVNQDGEVELVIGSSGGARITTVNAQVAARILWFKQTVKEAIEHLRFHHQLIPNHIIFEENFPKNIMNTLNTKYGHEYTERTTYMAVVQGVARNQYTGEIEAISDQRKYGQASLLQKNVTIST
ncbi:hypothetical protein LOTGIDRAFT_208751 [Lottia gigantea]|uniref:Gamma-glutamyltransferase n=1 Tax=Lottia gigantea TaxID=225164 RepID=V4A181_LOTGI|nr:hypothetical protein LOTGIDRAFT_208751 [Lottia gigantea]ESO97578.1 hypothetical protein LOTGIDRAFT_208751 [Lottia gigantea]